MNVEIGRRPKALDRRDCAAVGLKGLVTGLIQQVARDYAVHHLQHRRDQHRLRGQLVKRSGMGSDSTHWRTGTRGMTWSSRCAAVCDMRRAPHEGQNPRRLQLNATSLSCLQSAQRRRGPPCARMPHSRNASNSSLTNCGRLAPRVSSVWAKKELWACCCTSLIDLREILLGCKQRYLAFLGSLDDTSAGERDLQRLSQPKVALGGEQSVKGLNFFNSSEQTQLKALQHGEFNIHGCRRADLARHVPMTPSALSRQLTRLRMLGLIKKVAHTYRYYLTRLGRSAIASACSVTRFNIVPAMAGTI